MAFVGSFWSEWCVCVRNSDAWCVGVCVLETSHSIFHLWKMFPNAIINNNKNNRNKNVMSVISVGPEKWRIDKPNSKIFDTKWLKDKSIWNIGLNRRRSESCEEYKYIVYDERDISPEGTEVRNKCHKRNGIQFIWPIVCFFFHRWFNTENFLNCVR